MRWVVCYFFLFIPMFLLSACKNEISDSNIPSATMVSPATVTQTTSPLVITVPMTTSVALTPTLQTLLHYQGSNPYREHPRFDLAYDPLHWSLVNDEGTGLGIRLVNNSIDDCYLRLQAGPIGAQSLAPVLLAGREWTISQIQPKIVQYFFRIEDIGFILGLVLPEEYSPTIKGICQTQAEEVIDTFQIIE